MYRAGYCHDADVSIFSTIQLFSSLAALAYHNAQLEASAFPSTRPPRPLVLLVNFSSPILAGTAYSIMNIGTASQVIFSADETQLIAAIKGTPPAAGFLALWDVSANGTLSANFTTVAPPSGGGLPFGMTLIPNTNAFVVADPAGGFDIFNLDDPSQNTAVPIAGNAANCWSEFSPSTGHFFITDAAISTLTEVAVDGNLTGSVIRVIFLFHIRHIYRYADCMRLDL